MIDIITTDPEEILQEKRVFDIFCGILFNSKDFAPGKTETIRYHFDCPEYKELISKYHIDKIAGEGSPFQRAERLLHWMSPRLTHKSDYDNHVAANSLALLEYSLDKPERGINCKNKSIIMTECCLALGITARRVYIMPYSPYDNDNHVVSEIYDPEKGWVMMDPSTDGYFADASGKPLSLLELRNIYAGYGYASFTGPGDSETGSALWDKYSWTNAYIAKNIFRFMVDGDNGFGMADKRFLYFTPAGYKVNENRIMSIKFNQKQMPPDALRIQKLLSEMLEKAKGEPEPEACALAALEAKP